MWKLGKNKAMDSKISASQRTYRLSTAEYRDWYRAERIPKFYSPVIHIGYNLGVLLALIVGHFYYVGSWGLSSILVLAFAFLLGNVVIYSLHRFPLHHRLKYVTALYDAHTVEHHRFFTTNYGEYSGSRDLFIIFFPTFFLTAFALLLQPVFFFSVRALLGTDIAHIFSGATAVYFFLYEFFHWASHTREGHFVQKSAWIRYMRNHHRVHHNPKLMRSYNFTIVYPLMDLLMGTLYRGPLPEERHEDHHQNVMENLG